MEFERPHRITVERRAPENDRGAPGLRFAGLLAFALLGVACRGEGEVLDLSDPLSEPATGRCALDVLDASSDLSVGRTLMSDWEAGSCYELTLTNDGSARQEWWVLIELTPGDASVDNRWNHTSIALGDTVSEWRGIASSNNITLEAGASIAVGACFSC